MITLSDKEQLLLQAALMNLSITDLSNVVSEVLPLLKYTRHLRGHQHSQFSVRTDYPKPLRDSYLPISLQIDFEKVATITGHANKGVARTMFRRMMVKIASGDQPTPTTSKSRKRKVNDMADKDDEGNAKGEVAYYHSASILISLTIGTKKSRAKAYPVAEESSDEERNDFKAKIKREHQSDALESQ